MSTYDESVAATKTIASTILVKSLTTAIVGAVPFLGVPPFSTLLNKALAWIIEKAVNQAELSAFIVRTDLRVDSQGNDYLQAVIRHQKAIAGTDKTEIESATKNLDDSFAKFIVITN